MYCVTRVGREVRQASQFTLAAKLYMVYHGVQATIRTLSQSSVITGEIYFVSCNYICPKTANGEEFI